MENVVEQIKSIMAEAAGYHGEDLQFWMSGEKLVMRIGFWEEIAPEAHYKLAQAGLVGWEDRYDDDDCRPRYSYEFELSTFAGS